MSPATIMYCKVKLLEIGNCDTFESKLYESLCYE